MKNLMKKAREAQKDERGLTLVELLAVVVILAIVAAIAFVLIGNVIENSKKDAHISNAQQFISAVKLAEASDDVDLSDPFDVIAAVGTDAEIDTIGPVLEPWGDKAEYTKAEITKIDGVYSITLSGVESDLMCEIDEEEEETLQREGRSICD